MESVYCSFYTKSEAIVDYMVAQLDAQPASRILEPCAGDGVFIDALLKDTPSLCVEACELNPSAVNILRNKYRYVSNVEVHHVDTITDASLTLRANLGRGFDRIIGNPPYGGWQDYTKRRDLKKTFPGLYVKETYALFIYRCLQLLQPGGLLVFIVPDTFLNVHMHTALRRFILTESRIREISIFPSSFFPGVRYGYCKMSIITLQKSAGQSESLRNKFRVLTDLKAPEDLVANCRAHASLTVSQQAMFDNADHALFVSPNSRVAAVINDSHECIGEVASCVTGFYSGNDKEFVRPTSPNIRGASRYKLLSPDSISTDYLHCSHILRGLGGRRHFIPIVKGGGRRYFKPDMWYIDWSVTAVAGYQSNKKARFQNSEYYFKRGLAVPMVSSSSVSATIMADRVFDQSIVGVFPFRERWLYYLLALFNSPTCTTLLRTINPSANNSANYVKKIPFLTPPAKLLRRINGLVKILIEQSINEAGIDPQTQEQTNSAIGDVYGF